MKQESGKIQMAKLARLYHREAELHDQLAENSAAKAAIFSELAEGETVDLRTGKMRPKFRRVQLPTDITLEERAVAVEALRDNELRRRTAR